MKIPLQFSFFLITTIINFQILAKNKQLPWEKLLRLADFQREANLGLKEAIKLVQNVLHEAPYSKDEVRLRLSHLLLFVII